MFDEREDNSMKNIEKIMKFLKKTKSEYLESLRFKGRGISQNVEGLKISTWLIKDELALFYGHTCWTLLENNILKVEAWKIMPPKNIKILLVQFNDGSKLLFERQPESDKKIDLSLLTEEDWERLEQDMRVDSEKEELIVQMLNE